MKRQIEVIAKFLVLSVAPMGLAQHGETGVHLQGARLDLGASNSAIAGTKQALLIQAKGIQREALEYGMRTTEAARETSRLMGDNSYWNALHGPTTLVLFSEIGIGFSRPLPTWQISAGWNACELP